MTKDPTKAKKFQSTLRNLLGAPPKQHKEMKVGKTQQKKTRTKSTRQKKESAKKPK